MDDLKDKVVVVTGASAGIGAAIALKFAEQGSKLALCGQNKEDLAKVSKQCEEKGLDKSKIYTVTADLTKDEEIQNLVKLITEHFQQVDVLVNNAGFATSGGIEVAKLEDFDAMYTIHLRAVVSLTQKFLPFLKRSKGVIVNISSVSGIRPEPQFLAYGTLKSAQDHLTRCLAAELGPHQIRVIGINPSAVRSTNFGVTAGLFKTGEESLEFMENHFKGYPLGRCGFPEEVANIVVFMASKKASFVTGCNMLVDGGFAQTVGAF